MRRDTYGCRRMDIAEVLNPFSHPLLCRDLVPCDPQNPRVARHTSSPATPAAHPVSWAAPCIPSTAVGLGGGSEERGSGCPRDFFPSHVRGPAVLPTHSCHPSGMSSSIPGPKVHPDMMQPRSLSRALHAHLCTPGHSPGFQPHHFKTLLGIIRSGHPLGGTTQSPSALSIQGGAALPGAAATQTSSDRPRIFYRRNRAGAGGTPTHTHNAVQRNGFTKESGESGGAPGSAGGRGAGLLGQQRVVCSGSLRALDDFPLGIPSIIAPPLLPRTSRETSRPEGRWRAERLGAAGSSCPTFGAAPPSPHAVP